MLTRRGSFLLHAARTPSQRLYASKLPLHTSDLPNPHLNFKKIISNLDQVNSNAQNRKVQLPSIHEMKSSYEEWKHFENEVSRKRHARGLAGERLNESAKARDTSAHEVALAEATKLKAEVKQLEAALVAAEARCLHWASKVPNDTHPQTPIGPESSAVTLSTHLTNDHTFTAQVQRDHLLVSKQLDLLDLESGATVTGTSWYFLKNEAALLELALTNYAMSIAVKWGFTPMTTPDVVRSDIAMRCGFQPRDTADPPVNHMYHLQSSSAFSPEFVLSGTSEIPLAGLFANKIHLGSSLPMKVVGVGHAFRSEAGARSADTRGLYRVHQFTKVELFAVTAVNDSENMLNEMMEIQKEILRGLDLPFRVLDMPTEELGATAYRKIDMEVWMPGRGSWGEVSSLSNCTDYQARRLIIRYKHTSCEPQHGTQLLFAHTLNGTAAAVPRLIVALLENGAIFDAESNIVGLRLPQVLKRFWIGSDERNFVQWAQVH